MEILQAILLGIIEGLTEFLPISSTGHLIIAEKYMDFYDDAKIFTVIVQLGAMAAVVWYYRSDLAKRLAGLFRWQADQVRFFRNLIIATIPAGLAGLALSSKLEDYAKPAVVAAALIGGAFILILVDRTPTDKKQSVHLDRISAKQALGVGLAQMVALIPGTSRSGASIVGGLLGGLNRVTATAFSFYLGIPILAMAGAYKLAKDFGEASQVSGGWASIIVGTFTAFIVALLSISWLLKYVSTHNFRIFAYYRIVLGILVLILLV